MKNKITVSIAGQEYTMVAEEGEDYVKRCAALVDSQVRDVMNGAAWVGPTPRCWPP